MLSIPQDNKEIQNTITQPEISLNLIQILKFEEKFSSIPTINFFENNDSIFIPSTKINSYKSISDIMQQFDLSTEKQRNLIVSQLKGDNIDEEFIWFKTRFKSQDLTSYTILNYETIINKSFL